MRMIGRGLGAIVAVFISTFSLDAAPVPGNELADPSANFETIASCLSRGEEIVLTKTNDPRCVSYRRAADTEDYVPFDAAFHIDVNEVCRDGSTDKRRLKGDFVRRLVANKTAVIASQGIRIIGAVFCEVLDLVGLDLNYSLVLDRALFRQDIDARNLRVRGDLSLDRSIILTRLRLFRSHIDGSMFANRGYARDISIYDTNVDNSVLLRYGMYAQVLFEGVKIGGELSVRESALSTLLVELSKVRSLSLLGSEAQCWYKIRKNELGDVTAADVGFGEVRAQDQPANWVRRASFVTRVQNSATMAQFKQSLGSCRVEGRLHVLELSENQIRSSLCVQSFHWLTSKPPQASYLVINHTLVGSNVVINLWPGDLPNTAANGTAPASLEIIGLTASGLILNFSEGAMPRKLALNGLKFERVYASAGARCEQPVEEASVSVGARLVDRERRLSAPPPPQIIRWLDKNDIRSVQPFTAFIEAFDRAGDNARPLRIARAEKEIEIQRRSLSANAPADDNLITTGSVSERSAAPNWMASMEERAAISLRVMLGWIADYGYQPVKALWYIFALIVGYFVLFWLVIGIVGFKSQGGTRILPVGMMFLFDRLIPLYNINEAHQKLAVFYRRTRRNAVAAEVDSSSPQPAPEVMKYLWFTIPVEAAVDNQARWADYSLSILKIVGAIFAVFLVAAVNALVNH